VSRPPSAAGVAGHRWNVQRAPRARLPYRALCECGWTSTAGQHDQVLLELKAHLEETLGLGAKLSTGRDGQPTVEESHPSRRGS
jgi:hypothetical protein